MFDSVYQKALSGDLKSVELLEDMANKGKIAVNNAAIIASAMFELVQSTKQINAALEDLFSEVNIDA